jgi:glutamate synthase domain-containing protein 3
VEGVTARVDAGRVEFDLAATPLRDVNQFLHQELAARGVRQAEILHPDGKHNIAVGLDSDVEVHIRGHVGYYAAAMNKRAGVTIHGSAGRGVAENIMSGTVRVRGNASDCAAASGCGGLVIVEGDAASRCGISLKGADIVVAGSVGHASGFMAQVGRMVICGDAAAGLGDSLYEAVIYVRGRIDGLGADARVEPMTDRDRRAVAELLTAAGLDHDPTEFKRVGSARTLYHWNVEHVGHYG